MSLVLSRKPGQQIVIGESVITLTQVRGQVAKIAVDAPKHVRIVRAELDPIRTHTPQWPVVQPLPMEAKDA